MPENKDRKVVITNGGLFSDLVVRVKLVIRLLGDARVSPLLKLLPVGALIYFIIPDLVIGPLDDAALIWLGGYLFVEMCPPEIVQEHLRSLNQVIPGVWKEEPHEMDSDVIEGEFWDKQE